VSQHVEQSLLHRELIEENKIKDDPADGKQAVRRAVHHRGAGGRCRHVINKQGDGQSDRESEQGRIVNADAKKGDGAQEHYDRKRGNGCGKEGVSERIIVLQPVFHARWWCGEGKWNSPKSPVAFPNSSNRVVHSAQRRVRKLLYRLRLTLEAI